jgi:long-chain acyl-CoA synthetase
VTTVWEAWVQGSRHHANLPCLGVRDTVPSAAAAAAVAAGSGGGPAPTAGPYRFLTYAEVDARVVDLASGMRKLGLARGERVGIYANNRPEWLIVDLACQMLGMVSVPLYDSLGGDAIKYVINHARLPVVFCSKENTTKVLSTAGVSRDECASLKIIVEISDSNEVPEATLEYAERAGMEVFSFREVESEGAAAKVHADPPKPEDIFTIIYTSGTSGVPKGVVHSHATFVASLTGILRQGVLVPGKDDSALSYLPLAHILERGVVHLLLMQGARVAFSRGDMKVLGDDILALRPTIFVGVPRVFSRLFQKVRQGVAGQNPISRFLFGMGLDSKRSAMHDGDTDASRAPIWDSLIFSRTAERMGGRVKLIVSGGAPLSGEVQEFLAACFCCPVLQVYGLTEVGAATFATRGDSKVDHVGPPVPSCEVKLVDREEMGYTANDRPLPRGEVCVRGPSVFLGYFEEEELTSEAIDDDGWFHTGDIGQWNPNGTLTIIDRAKAMFKLSQGEYVAPETVESALSTSRYVLQIFAHGDSQRDALVAVVVPDPEAVTTYAKEHDMNDPDNFEALCKNETIINLVEDDLAALAKERSLRGFEVPKGVHLEPKPWVVGVDLTPTMKLRRAALASRYRPEIDAVYAKVAYKKKMADMYSGLTG